MPEESYGLNLGISGSPCAAPSTNLKLKDHQGPLSHISSSSGARASSASEPGGRDVIDGSTGESQVSPFQNLYFSKS